MLDRIANGRTDLVFELLADGGSADAKDTNGTSLIQWCHYYGDVSAMRYLVANGASLASLGNNHDLNGASFHGHWRLCQYLIESGADVNRPMPATGETPLHAALCRPGGAGTVALVHVLLAHGANPNAATKESAETGSFMRDARTRGETPLHRAAAFGDAETIDLLIEAEANREARDMNGDTPLSWASWYRRPTAILRKLCYGEFNVHPERRTMEDYLVGKAHAPD